MAAERQAAQRHATPVLPFENFLKIDRQANVVAVFRCHALHQRANLVFRSGRWRFAYNLPITVLGNHVPVHWPLCGGRPARDKPNASQYEGSDANYTGNRVRVMKPAPVWGSRLISVIACHARCLLHLALSCPVPRVLSPFALRPTVCATIGTELRRAAASCNVCIRQFIALTHTHSICE